MLADERRRQGLTALLCLAAAAVLAGLCSMSSPLFPLNIWNDANCLLTVGRVMKAGGVLYRDVYEQKGPLLYLIHMLAACVSDSGFLGVYLFEVMSLAVTLFFAWKLVRAWTDDEAALGAALLMGACVLVSRSFSRGDSAEEFCLPFLMAALQIACGEPRGEAGLPLGRMFVLGMLAGCVATIKYTALGLFLGLCLVQGVYGLARRRPGHVLCSAAVFLAGMLIPVLPWVVYFAANGALGDAYTAYIHNNIFLYNAQERSWAAIADCVLQAGWNNAAWAVFAALGVCAYGLSRRREAFGRLAVALSALGAFAAVFLPGEIYPYYPLVLSVFAAFGIGKAAAWLRRFLPKRGAWSMACGALSLAMALWLSPNAFLRGVSLEETAQGRLAAQMEPGATLLQYSHLDDGLYLTSGALPQEKYFVLLNVAYDEMREALDDAVRSGRPDYVLVSWRELPQEFDKYELAAHEIGYDDENRMSKDLYLYRRKEP